MSGAPLNTEGTPSNAFRETRGSIVSTSRTSLFSPGSTNRNQSPGFGTSQNEWSKKSIDILNQQISQNPFKSQAPSESRVARRMISLDGERTKTGVTGQSIQTMQFKDQTGGLVLPDINNPMVSTNYNQRFGAASQSPLGAINLNSKMSMTATGGAGFSSTTNYGIGLGNKATMRTIDNEPSSNLVGSGISGGPVRPPLYIPTKREGGRSSTIG